MLYQKILTEEQPYQLILGRLSGFAEHRHADMEFNYCTRDAGKTNFEYAKELYESYGYHLPQVVFWNVQSRQEQVPVKMNEQGVALVSGCSPRIFNMVMQNELDPYKFMMNIIGSERYAPITA